MLRPTLVTECPGCRPVVGRSPWDWPHRICEGPLGASRLEGPAHTQQHMVHGAEGRTTEGGNNERDGGACSASTSPRRNGRRRPPLCHHTPWSGAAVDVSHSTLGTTKPNLWRCSVHVACEVSWPAVVGTVAPNQGLQHTTGGRLVYVWLAIPQKPSLCMNGDLPACMPARPPACTPTCPSTRPPRLLAFDVCAPLWGVVPPTLAEHSVPAVQSEASRI